ncbi:hypothetical protein LRE75_17520 [Streptomyces sp. 372A]
MSLRSDHPWRIDLDERPLATLPPHLGSVAVGMALGLPAIDALVASGADVGPVKYCLTHFRLLVPVEADAVHRWRAAHSACAPAARSWQCDMGGYLGCTGLWVTRPDAASSRVTPADALHEVLSLTRARLRAPHPRHREVCHA